MIYVKTYWTPMGVMVAACDRDCLGKQYREGELRLHVSERFYKGEELELELLQTYLRSCSTANLVGEEVVGFAVKTGFIDPKGILRIGGVPHAQLYKM